MTLSLNEAKSNLAKDIYMHQCIDYLQQSDVLDHHSNTYGRLRLTHELRGIKNYMKGDHHQFEAAYQRVKKLANELNLTFRLED